MATRHFIPLLGKRLRVTRLDDCGNPPAAAEEDAFVATDGFISVSLSAETEDGNEIITKKADGSMCVNEMTDSSFKRFTVEMEFCGVDPGLLSLTTNAEPYLDGTDGDTIGFTVPEGTLDKRFALELWTGLSGAECEPGEEASGYLLLPFLRAGVLGDITVDGENAVTYSMTGASTKGGNSWGVGPFEDVIDDGGTAGPLPTALDPFDHLLMVETNVAPPPHEIGLQAMPGTAA